MVLELAVERGPPTEQVVWAAFSAPEILPGRLRQDGPHVILISLDTLRADHLGCYGYRRPTSPHLDALAARGFRFAQAVSQSPWTRPSHKSLFTGQYPLSRGGAEAERLATVLWRAGYRTGALTGGGQVASRFGFATGFESYRESKALRSRCLKVIYSYPRHKGPGDHAKLRLFDLVRDPREQYNLAAERAELAARLRSKVETMIGIGDSSPEFEEEVPKGLDPELRQELEALGYVGGG